MNQQELTYVQNTMRVIEGATNITFGRAGAMAWLGVQKDGLEYALHLQTAFRVKLGDEIVLGNLDIFEPTQSLLDSPSFDWDTYQWDAQGLNRYDEWGKKFKKEYGDSATVSSALINSWGDITLIFSNEITMDVMISGTVGECWRFFQRHSNDNHLVVTARGIDVDD